MSTPSDHPAGRRPFRLDTPAALLWASAFVLAALVLITAGRHGTPAQADVIKSRPIVASSLMTERDEDVIVILDERAGLIFVYDGYDEGQLELVDLRPIDQMFRTR